MKFVVSSTGLLSQLQAVSRVISSKNTLPILDNFLFKIEGNEMEITASDLETTLVTTIELDNVEGEGGITIPAKLLTDTLKEFPEQPLTFDINQETMVIEILSENGKFSIMGQEIDEYPQVPETEEDIFSITFDSGTMLRGIEKSLFATSDDDLRPVMTGIFVQFTPTMMKIASSDAHKLVRYSRTDVQADGEASFILPKKPANLLKNILAKRTGDLVLQFDKKNAYFNFANYKLICRLIEGVYPNYEAIIAAHNENKFIIDRHDFYNTLKRISVFSNQASNLVKIKLTGNQMLVSAQDIDFSISAYERLNCQYDGKDMEVGYKSTFMLEILNNLPAMNVVVELSSANQATLLYPEDKDFEEEDILMLIMPMMIDTNYDNNYRNDDDDEDEDVDDDDDDDNDSEDN